MRATVRRLLAERGYQATTIPAVARASGVGAPTIYRRWATQSELIESALKQDLQAAEYQAGMDFATYLSSFVPSVVGYFADPATRAAVPGLLVEYYRDPAKYASLVEHAEDPIRAQFRLAHAAAVEAGTVASTPPADALFDTIIGLAIYHGVWRHTADDQLVHAVLAVVEAAARPAK